MCFTAGSGGMYFGAGVVHAYLASRRKAPRVAAGISAGALSAAALQKCYADLEDAEPARTNATDAKARWGWFRRYLRALTDNPLSVLWDAIPDMSDFFADMPPIRDTSLSAKDEAGARRQRYILIKIGRWLANLGITVRTVAETAVNYVRQKEGYGDFSRLRFLSRAVYLLVRLAAAMVAPSRKNFFPECFAVTQEDDVWSAMRFRKVRPLFGWKIYFLALAICLVCLLLLTSCLALVTLGAIRTRLFGWENRWVLGFSFLAALTVIGLVLWMLAVPAFPPQNTRRQHIWTAVSLLPVAVVLGLGFGSLARYVSLNGAWWYSLIAVGALLAGRAVYLLWQRRKHAGRPFAVDALLQLLTEQIGIRKELVTDFYLMIKLRQLFDPESLVHPKQEKPVEDKPMPVVLVAAPLQTIIRQREKTHEPYLVSAQQVWASSGPGTSLVKALRAAIGLPGLMTPVHCKDAALWGVNPAAAGDGSGDVTSLRGGQVLDLVDGSVIRQNPIPALFGFLQKDAEQTGKSAIAWSLESKAEDDRRLHVVYTVPLEARQVEAGQPAPAMSSDIVDVVRLSMRLARHRDTKLEMQQTEFISQLEKLVRPSTEPLELTSRDRGVRFKILPDAIAPEADISIGGLQPDPKACLSVVAAGCRQTMRTLYASRLPQDGWERNCTEVCAEVWNTEGGPIAGAPGLPEVCAECTQKLSRPSRPADPAVRVTHKEFPQLNGTGPRIIFVASGGVFRGPFQVGVLAALLRVNVSVDLIVGASVGTLVGGVLGASLVARNVAAIANYDSIYALVDLFVHADKSIALTQTLKSALREIGIRARSIQLSPFELQRMMQRGSRFDPGFAAVGAPPAVLDAISTLLVLPLEKTKEAAGHFASGHIVEGVQCLLKQVRQETLSRLGIVNYLMGVSLLEPAARKLLAPPGSAGYIQLDKPQPFMEYGKVALFATATNLLTWEAKLLGSPSDFGSTYDFVEAALSSSAFPAVFQPRRQADVYPGCGSTGVLYSDGGMFDNLPFIPALDILGTVQGSYAQAQGWQDAASAMDQLEARHSRPDLIIAASLNVNPEDEPGREGPFDSILAVWNRAKVLDRNVKIRDFQLAATRVHQQIERLLARYPRGARSNIPGMTAGVKFINEIVDAAVLPVFPSSEEHLNGTFAFCRTLGLNEDRIQLSVGDGCYQTLAALARPQAQQTGMTEADELVGKSVNRLVEIGRLPSIKRVSAPEEAPDASCPFFSLPSDRDAVGFFRCPFREAQETNTAQSVLQKEWGESASGVYDVCRSDKQHIRSSAAMSSGRL